MPHLKRNIALLLLCLATLLPRTSECQIITTVAGCGSFSYSGDGGPATNAGFHGMAGITADIYGNVYHVEVDRVRITNAAGIINTFAGAGTITTDGIPATDAFLSPGGLLADAAGNIYMTDGCRVRKVNRAGIINTVAGTGGCGHLGDGGPATAAQLYGPQSLAVDWIGNLYINCRYNIRKVDTSGIISTIAGGTVYGYSGDGGPATTALFNVIQQIAVDLSGNLYIADGGNNRVRKINPTGIISTFAGNGSMGFSGDGSPATAAAIDDVTGTTVDNFGNVYISTPSNRIRRIDTNGIITTIAGIGIPWFAGDGGPATAAALNSPWWLYAFNDIYISDINNRRIRVISNPNTAPHFTHGHVQSVIVCPEIFPLDSLLQVMDADTSQLLRWTLIGAPAHGSATVYYTATSTGGAITPIGLVYTHGTGFIGTDTVRVRVTDGVRSDTTIICMTVDCPSEILRYTVPDEVAVYPSPNNGSFVVQLRELNSEAHIVISNTLGQIVKEINTTDKHIPVRLDAPPGLYFVRASVGGNSWSRKVVVN